MSEIRHITVQCKRIPVVLEAEGKEEKCSVREMLGSQASQYTKSQSENFDYEIDAETGEFKITGIKNLAGTELALLSRTLFHENNKAFSEDEINNLSSSAQKELFAIAQDINALTAEAKKDAKKE